MAFKCIINNIKLNSIPILIALMAFSQISGATTIVTGTTKGVKFYPGHYIHVMGGDLSVNGSTMKDAYNEMNATNSGFVGIQLRLEWSQIETSKDVYNYSIIDGHLAKLLPTKKRLFLLVYTKNFSGTTPVVPAYIKNDPIYDGGFYYHGDPKTGEIKGTNSKLWNNNIRDRFVKLMNKLGARYNSHSHFAGIILNETSMGTRVSGPAVTDAQETAFYNNLIYINQKMRYAFPNTITSQFTNYSRKMLESFTTSLKNMGAALGGPDIFMDDPGLKMIGDQYNYAGVYTYYPKLSGVVALTPSVMNGNYIHSIAGDPSSPPQSIDDLLDFGRVNLKANIMFWTRSPDYFPQVLQKIKNLTINNSPRVKLISTCPSKYVPCIID